MEPMREMADRVEQAIAAAPARLDDQATVELGLRALADWMLRRLAAADRLLPRRAGDEQPCARSRPTQLPDREREIAEQLLRRRGAEPPADWRTRLLVARAVAGFRVWLDDMRCGAVADPRGHLETILAAR